MLITTKLNLETAGGSVVDLHLKAKSLVELGHAVTVVTAFSENNQPARNLPYTLCEEFKPSRRLLAIQKSGYELFKKYEKDADVFYIDGHVFCYGAGFYRLTGGKVPVAGFFNIKLTGWFDAHPELRAKPLLKQFKAYLRGLIERWLLVIFARTLDAYIFTTPQVAALYREHGFPNRNTYIIPDLADGGSHIPIPEHRAHAPLRFFASGRMIPEKGFDFLLRSFALVQDTTAHLTISGGGPEADNLKKLAHELGISDRVEFPGWVSRDNLYHLMDDSDVFIFPRWTIEYSSVLLIEAMMRHMPSIVPRGGGIEWLARDAAHAFEDGKEEALANVIRQLAASPQEINSLSALAEARGKELHQQVLGKKLSDVLSEVTRA